MAMKNRTSESKRNNNVNNQPPQWSDFLLCSYCEKEFNRTDRCPISLACGHTLCRACLGKLKQLQCQYDQTPITCNIHDLPTNTALLQLLPGDSEKGNLLSHHHVLQSNTCDAVNSSHYNNAKACIEELALFLKPERNCELSRPMQRKLVTLINCQLYEEEGRKRALRASRALGERTATELILLHQNPTTLSASLWAAVRARGCQFLGPAMQEEALKLIHLALEDRSELSRKVLVGIVVKNLQTQFSQASKTSIGHVVQLLYRASCFKVTKRNADSSLMRLKDEYLSYDDLRKEHDSQVVQIAREAGLRIAPDQWSALLYGDQTHKPYMQSIIDRLQSGSSFKQCISDLGLALQRSCDPGNVQSLLLHFKFLSELDTETTCWSALEKSTYSAKVSVKELVNFTKNHHHWLWQCQDATQQTSKYKTSMCRDSKSKGVCPRGQACTFAHSDEELQHYRNKRKKGGQIPFSPNDFKNDSGNSSDVSLSQHEDVPSREELGIASQDVIQPMPHAHVCQCGSTANQNLDMQNPAYLYSQPSSVNNAPVINHAISPNLAHAAPVHQNMNHSFPLHIPQRLPSVLPVQNMSQQLPSQVQYITGNNAMYEPKAQTFEPVHVVQNNQPRYPHAISKANVKVQNPNIEQLSPAVVHPNHYVVHRQQTPGYCQLQPNPVQTAVPEPVVSPPHQPYTVGPSYTCLTLQNGQQLAVPANPRRELVQQPAVVYQQQPIPMQNISPNSVVNYQGNVVLQTASHPSHIPGVPPPPLVSHGEPAIANAEVVLPREEPIILRNQTYSQYHVTVPPVLENSANMPTLAELRHRKYEVINKLVKKRIVTPHAEDHLQSKVGSCYSMSEANEQMSSSMSSTSSQLLNNNNNERAPSNLNPVSTNCPSQTKRFSTFVSSHESLSNNSSVTHGLTLTSDGRYSLWTGTTCIPSLSGLSFYDYPSESRDQSSPTGIDVLSDLDTRTSQVQAFHHDNYVVKYSPPQFSPSKGCQVIPSSNTRHADGDVIPIQDQRIVSKYGPIARTVRSKTTSAIPEQVTANANAATHPFPSDKSRNKSNFIAGENMDKSQNILYISSEVEPTAESANSRILPDLISSNYSQTTAVQNHASYPAMQDPIMSEEIDPEENEDLLLAIELQQIEMGIQKIQRNAKSK